MDKRDKLEKLLARLQSPRPLGREFDRLYIEDTDGSQVSLKSPDAIAVIQRRLAAMEAPAEASE